MKGKEFFAWVGQKATYGNPNPITGKYSLCGRFYRFATRKERDEYVRNFRAHNPSEFAVSVNRKSGRKYELGSSVYGYNVALDYLESTEEKP